MFAAIAPVKSQSGQFVGDEYRIELRRTVKACSSVRSRQSAFLLPSRSKFRGFYTVWRQFDTGVAYTLILLWRDLVCESRRLIVCCVLQTGVSNVSSCAASVSMILCSHTRGRFQSAITTTFHCNEMVRCTVGELQFQHQLMTSRCYLVCWRLCATLALIR